MGVSSTARKDWAAPLAFRDASTWYAASPWQWVVILTAPLIGGAGPDLRDAGSRLRCRTTAVRRGVVRRVPAGTRRGSPARASARQCASVRVSGTSGHQPPERVGGRTGQGRPAPDRKGRI